MAQDYKIDEQQQVIWTRCWGTLSDQDVVTQQASLRANPQFRSTLNQLVDASDVTEVAVSLEMVNQMGASTLFAPTSRRAYVVGKDALYGLVRMYELHQSARGSETVRVFRDRAVALAWLQINERTSGVEPDRSKSA